MEGMRVDFTLFPRVYINPNRCCEEYLYDWTSHVALRDTRRSLEKNVSSEYKGYKGDGKPPVPLSASAITSRDKSGESIELTLWSRDITRGLVVFTDSKHCAAWANAISAPKTPSTWSDLLDLTWPKDDREYFSLPSSNELADRLESRSMSPRLPEPSYFD